jgi:hypothetical protein
VVVEPGTANEEKILVTRTGSTDTTINVYATPSVAANRGADGTSSVAHSSGVTVFPVFTALDADEANELTSAFGSKGDLVSYGSSTFETLGVGTNDQVLIADSGEASGLKWGSVDTAQLAAASVTGPKLANATVETKTASYTLVAGDRNKRIVMNNAGATTITVDDSVFAAGDVVWLHNIGAGTCTVTAGTATVNTAASLDLAQWEGGSLYFTSASSAIFFRGGGAGLNYGTATGGSSSSITVGGESYTLLQFTTSGNLTVTADGVFDFVVVGGGGKGGQGYFSGSSGGGGGGGGVITGTIGLTAGTHAIVIGAGGTTNLGGSGLPGEPGSPSSLGAIEAVGGGGGGGFLIAQGNSYNNFKGYVMVGGSGGGSNSSGANQIAAPAIGTQQGNDGGEGLYDIGGGASGGGGGGGYTSAGSNGSAGTGGAGGNGYDPSTFTGSTITTAFGAGGGGAGSSTGGTGGSSSAGGNGGSGGAGSAAANYGNGGGGGDYSAAGGNGTNGIVLVRFKN